MKTKTKKSIFLIVLGLIALILLILFNGCEKEPVIKYVNIYDTVIVSDTIHDTIQCNSNSNFNITTCFLFDDYYNKNEMAWYNFKKEGDEDIKMTIILFDDGPQGPEVIDSNELIITDNIGILNINKEQQTLVLSMYYPTYSYVYKGSFRNTDELPSYEDVYRNLLNKGTKRKLIFY